MKTKFVGTVVFPVNSAAGYVTLPIRNLRRKTPPENRTESMGPGPVERESVHFPGEPMRSALASILPALLIAGCAATPTGDMNAAKITWGGVTYDEVVARWGQPVYYTTLSD